MDSDSSRTNRKMSQQHRRAACSKRSVDDDGGLAAMTLTTWLVTRCVSEKKARSPAIAREIACVAECQQQRIAPDSEIPALETLALPGFSIASVPSSQVRPDSSRAGGELRARGSTTFRTRTGTGSSWREGSLAKAKTMPMPGDPVDRVMANHNGNYLLARAAEQALSAHHASLIEPPQGMGASTGVPARAPFVRTSCESCL
jgi:hypothetical protein